jgi:hypothetical protein
MELDIKRVKKTYVAYNTNLKLRRIYLEINLLQMLLCYSQLWIISRI